MKTLANRLSALAALLLVGCTGTPAELAEDDPNARDRDVAPVTDDELATMPAPEPDAPASEYRATAPALRLLGVQRGDRPFATIMDTTTWHARNVAPGELIGRNLVVAGIGDGWIDLRDGSGAVQRLAVGKGAPVRQVRHRFDEMATYAGKAVWNVSAEILAQVRARYGVGAAAEQRDDLFEGMPAIRLTEVTRGSVFDRLGFRRGDLLFRVDGETLRPDDLERVADRLINPREKAVTVQMLRGGNPSSIAFHVY
jgi:PDZ domain